ncbi:hypothetical protein ABFS83_03G058400 [Erythranthe nasuta]
MATDFPPYPPCAAYPCRTRECCGLFKYKTEWPNLVGMAAEQAKAIIVKDNPIVAVVLVHKDEGVVDDFCCNRVWLFVDDKNHVSQVPMVG